MTCPDIGAMSRSILRLLTRSRMWPSISTSNTAENVYSAVPTPTRIRTMVKALLAASSGCGELKPTVVTVMTDWKTGRGGRNRTADTPRAGHQHQRSAPRPILTLRNGSRIRVIMPEARSRARRRRSATLPSPRPALVGRLWHPVGYSCRFGGHRGGPTRAWRGWPSRRQAATPIRSNMLVPMIFLIALAGRPSCSQSNIPLDRRGPRDAASRSCRARGRAR